MDIKNSTATIKHWVELYTDNLYSWALFKTTNKEAAEDLVQDTFMVAVQSFEKYAGKSNAKTWLHGILNNKINDYHRSNFKKPSLVKTDFAELIFESDGHWKENERPQQWADDDGNLLDNKYFQLTLENCMKKLPPNWFSAIQLKYMEEKNGELICQEMGIAPTNFWQMLHRAKLQLRKCLELNWFKK